MQYATVKNGKDNMKSKSRASHGKERATEEPTGIECEICCTEDVPLHGLTHCEEGHLFCMSCARKMAESQIGMHRSTLGCMSMEVRTAGTFVQQRYTPTDLLTLLRGAMHRFINGEGLK